MSQLNWEQLAGVNLEYRLYPFEYFLAAQQKLGVRTIELWGGAPHFLLGYDEMQDCAALRRQVESFGLTVGAFVPECVTYPFPMCSGVPHIRQKALGYYTNAIHAAAELGASVVPLSCAGTLKDEDPALGFERAAEMLRALAGEAEKAGVILAVETLTSDVSCILNTLDELERLLKAVDSPNVKACLDVCAARTAGETLDQWFDRLGSDVVHIHFTDGKPGGRLVWGQGLHPLDDYVKTLCDRGYRGLLAANLNLRGMWFDPALVEDAGGYVGTGFTPENYWFDPAAADEEDLRVLAPYFAGGERSETK